MSIFNSLSHLFISASIAAVTFLAPVSKPVSVVVTPQPTASAVVINQPEYYSPISGEQTFLGKEVSYTVSIPKTNGKIKGTILGACTGNIDGDFAGTEGGNINGQAKANCSLGIINKEIEIDFTGKLYPQEGKLDYQASGAISLIGQGMGILHFSPLH